MKKKLIYISVLFLVVHFSFLLLFHYVNNRRNELVIKFDNILSSDKYYRTILAGDSHSNRSIDETKIDGLYSIAYFGENNVMTYYKIKYLLENKNLKDPEYIILPCDIVTFSKGFNLYRSQKGFYKNLIPLSELSEFEQDLYGSYYDYIKLTLFPYIEWQFAMNTAHQNRKKKNKLRFSELPIEKQKAKAKFFVQEELMCSKNYENLFAPTSLKYLEKTILLCKQNNVKPIFIKFPMTNYVFSEIKNNVNARYILIRPSEEIINKHDLPILNFERTFENNPELFFDSHHLNDYGKEMFTPIIKNALDSLYKVY